MKKELLAIGIFALYSIQAMNVHASLPPATFKDAMLQKYMSNYESKAQLEQLKKVTLENGGKSVDALIEVMKNGKYPDKNRWLATFMLGQIMGEKSSPFIAKFLRHPSWVMRMASLKTLLANKGVEFGGQYSMLLHDDSLLVRAQALENIRRLNLAKYAPEVWSMLYDKRNYSQATLNGKKLRRKRAHIISDVILAVGDLKFQAAGPVLFKMIQKDRYKDIFAEMDQSLGKLTGAKSPEGDIKMKKIFWQRKALDTTIQ